MLGLIKPSGLLGNSKPYDSSRHSLAKASTDLATALDIIRGSQVDTTRSHRQDISWTMSPSYSLCLLLLSLPPFPCFNYHALENWRQLTLSPFTGGLSHDAMLPIPTYHIFTPNSCELTFPDGLFLALILPQVKRHCSGMKFAGVVFDGYFNEEAALYYFLGLGLI